MAIIKPANEGLRDRHGGLGVLYSRLPILCEKMVDESTVRMILAAQRNEITEHHIYVRLSESVKGANNRAVLEHIAGDELRHYNLLKEQTGKEVKPDMLKVYWYVLISRILGLTFGIKLMENGEKGAQANYKGMPSAAMLSYDEERHERELIAMIDEEMLKYVSSIVLGINDALVEFTGALAGFTFALQNGRLIAVTGTIMGFAAALSMAASEYLSTKSESDGKNPLKASAYTGVVYLLTVILLVGPYILLSNVYISLALTLFIAIAVIAFFTYYISVAKDLLFRTQFLEMSAISLGVAALTFAIGFLVKTAFGASV